MSLSKRLATQVEAVQVELGALEAEFAERRKAATEAFANLKKEFRVEFFQRRKTLRRLEAALQAELPGQTTLPEEED